MLENDGMILERLLEFKDKINYKDGFYKGFNFNRVAEDLESIYILYDKEGTPLYVGESSRTKGRLIAHLNKYNNWNNALIDRIELVPFTKKTTKVERNLVERMFINLLNPKLNKINRNRNLNEEEFVSLNRLENPHSIHSMTKEEMEKF